MPSKGRTVKKNHNTMYSLIYRAKVLTRNIIGGFPTKAIAVLSFRLLPPLKTRQKQMISAPHSERSFTTKGKNEASFTWRKACHGLKGHSPTRATLGKTTFPTFPYKTWRTVYMRKKRDGQARRVSQLGG